MPRLTCLREPTQSIGDGGGGTAKAAPGGGSFTIKSIGNKDIVGSFNPTTPYKKQDMLYSVVTVTEGGWVEFATYVPVVNITGGGLRILTRVRSPQSRGAFTSIRSTKRDDRHEQRTPAKS